MGSIWGLTPVGANFVRRKLTQKFIAGLKPGEKVYDTEVKGFFIRWQKKGKSKVFAYRYRMNGKDRTATIGKYGPIGELWASGHLVHHDDPNNWSIGSPIKCARKEAQRLAGLVASGIDPAHSREQAKAAPTMRDLADDYMERYGNFKRTGAEDRRKIDKDILPAIGTKKVADVTRRDIEDIHRLKKDKPYAANRVLALLIRMFNVAISWDWRADNPAKGIKRYHETSSERFLSHNELSRLCKALADHPEHRSVNAIRLLMFTGARRSEVLKATWSQFDLEAGVWTKPGATTKTKTEHRVPLSAPALQLLADMKAVSESECLFPGNVPGQPLKDIKHSWASVCSAAELEGVRLHDLRHTFASLLASSGLSLPIIGKLLGHTKVSTTMRYAKLYDDPLREAVERVGAIVAGEGKQAEVVRFRGG